MSDSNENEVFMTKDVRNSKNRNGQKFDRDTAHEPRRIKNGQSKRRNKRIDPLEY